MKFLVVDDDFVTSTKLSALLDVYGECDVATNGSQAISMIDQSAASHAGYDLVLIDIHLPCASGWAVLKALQAREQQMGIKESKKLIITSEGTMQNVYRAGMYKCHGFLLKPIGKDVLFGKMRELGLPVGADG